MTTDAQHSPTIRVSTATAADPQPEAPMPPAAPEAPASGTSTDPLVGSTIAGRYRVVAKLGEGGMGAVYRVTHTGLHKDYALKVLRGQLGDAESQARFEREALASAHLEHRNIARCIDVGGMPDGGRFLVMELVEGESLSAMLEREGAITPSRALPLLAQIAEGLTCAHAKDIVHRDMKPDNIVVNREGVVKLIDFGIARARSQSLGGATALTKAGTMLGTPAYMSPEQVVGQAVDARADQYAFGVIAYEMLTGRPPFEAPDALALVFMHVGEVVPKASEKNKSLPAALDAALERVLAKLPAERFATVNEAHRAIADALEGRASALAPAPLSSVPMSPAPLSSVPMSSVPQSPSMTHAPAVALHSSTVIPSVATTQSPADPRWKWVSLAGVLALLAMVGIGYVTVARHGEANAASAAGTVGASAHPGASASGGGEPHQTSESQPSVLPNALREALGMTPSSEPNAAPPPSERRIPDEPPIRRENEDEGNDDDDRRARGSKHGRGHGHGRR
jgi:serine/threonine protein kinase